MKEIHLAAWLTVALALAPASAWAQAQRSADQEVAAAVARVLLGYAPLTIFDHIDAQVQDGLVTLQGRVTLAHKKTGIAQRVTQLAGVHAVRNEIRVLPTSQFDEDLRHRVARAIYGNPSFWNYAAMANPPIHIIVERGHVRLLGVVNSQVERMLARALATGLGEVSVTNELRTDQEVRSQ